MWRDMDMYVCVYIYIYINYAYDGPHKLRYEAMIWWLIPCSWE